MFKVLEINDYGDSSPNVHIFRSEEHFFEWMKEQISDEKEFNEFIDSWTTDGAVAHALSCTWEPYGDGLYEYDHTKE
jgi:hypothetical protein